MTEDTRSTKLSTATTTTTNGRSHPLSSSPPQQQQQQYQRGLTDDEIRLIFESLYLDVNTTNNNNNNKTTTAANRLIHHPYEENHHHNTKKTATNGTTTKTIQKNIPRFVIVPCGYQCEKLSPPPIAFPNGLYVLLRPTKHHHDHHDQNTKKVTATTKQQRQKQGSSTTTTIPTTTNHTNSINRMSTTINNTVCSNSISDTIPKHLQHYPIWSDNVQQQQHEQPLLSSSVGTTDTNNKKNKNYIAKLLPTTTTISKETKAMNDTAGLKWRLSGPQFPPPTAIQQRYCYPIVSAPAGSTNPTSSVGGTTSNHNNDAQTTGTVVAYTTTASNTAVSLSLSSSSTYCDSTGGALYTMYSATTGKELLDYRLLHVYYSSKRAGNKGVIAAVVGGTGSSPAEHSTTGTTTVATRRPLSSPALTQWTQPTTVTNNSSRNRTLRKTKRQYTVTASDTMQQVVMAPKTPTRPKKRMKKSPPSTPTLLLSSTSRPETNDRRYSNSPYHLGTAVQYYYSPSTYNYNNTWMMTNDDNYFVSDDNTRKIPSDQQFYYHYDHNRRRQQRSAHNFNVWSYDRKNENYPYQPHYNDNRISSSSHLHNNNNNDNKVGTGCISIPSSPTDDGMDITIGVTKTPNRHDDTSATTIRNEIKNNTTDWNNANYYSQSPSPFRRPIRMSTSPISIHNNISPLYCTGMNVRTTLDELDQYAELDDLSHSPSAISSAPSATSSLQPSRLPCSTAAPAQFNDQSTRQSFDIDDIDGYDNCCSRSPTIRNYDIDTLLSFPYDPFTRTTTTPSTGSDESIDRFVFSDESNMYDLTTGNYNDTSDLFPTGTSISSNDDTNTNTNLIQAFKRTLSDVQERIRERIMRMSTSTNHVPTNITTVGTTDVPIDDYNKNNDESKQQQNMLSSPLTSTPTREDTDVRRNQGEELQQRSKSTLLVNVVASWAQQVAQNPLSVNKGEP